VEAAPFRSSFFTHLLYRLSPIHVQKVNNLSLFDAKSFLSLEHSVEKKHFHPLKMFWNLASTIALFVLARDSGKRRTSSRQYESLSIESKNIERSKYDELLEWVKSKGGEVNQKIDIKRSSQGGGYGAFVTSDVSQDELLFAVPRDACFTLEAAISDETFGEAFNKLIEKAGPGGNTVVMAGYMATEYLLMLEDSKNEKADASSNWAAYFQTLPWERGLNNQEHILFWTEEMIEDLLRGSMCYSEATTLREEVVLATKIMNSVVGKSIRAARGEDVDLGGFSWPWDAKPPAPEGPPEGFPEAVKGAFVCLLTRAFQDGEGDEEKLVPMLDMLQHSDTPNVRHAMRKIDGTVEVRARCDIKPDTELFNQYRSEEEESMPYSRFFTRFGFVPGITEDTVNLLRDKSSIFYPQKAEI
jgi:hypothetical protein